MSGEGSDGDGIGREIEMGRRIGIGIAGLFAYLFPLVH